MTRIYIETVYAVPKLITRLSKKKHPNNCLSQEKHKRDRINQPILPPLALKSDYCSLKLRNKTAKVTHFEAQEYALFMH